MTWIALFLRVGPGSIEGFATGARDGGRRNHVWVDNTVDVLGLDDIKADLKLELPQPLKTETTSALKVEPLKADLGTTSHVQIDPLTTNSSLSVDLKPAVVDLCLTLNVGKLPNVCIKQPYHHHIGFTLWGTEVWDTPSPGSRRRSSRTSTQGQRSSRPPGRPRRRRVASPNRPRVRPAVFASGSVPEDDGMPELASSLVVGGSEDEPLVLAGPPRELTGRIQLHNPGDAKVVLRDAGLKDPSGLLRLPSSRHSLQPLVLRPDQGGSVPISIAVDPATPPGGYRAELELAGRSQPVVLHVAEVFDLSVQPRSLVVVNQSGVPQKKRLIITNDGNVAFTLGDLGTVDLREDLPSNRVVRVAVESLLDHEKLDLQALVVALLAVAREEDGRLGSLQVLARDGQVELRPGETKAVELEITLQDELPLNRRYRGRLPVLTRDVDIVVVASATPVQEQTPRRARQRAAGKKRPPRKGGTKR